MPRTAEEIVAAIEQAVVEGFRAHLITRGQARAMIWRDGVVPQGAPDFSPQLSFDLHSYGYSLLGLGLSLRELRGDTAQARLAFEQAANALESVVTRGRRQAADRDFHVILAASCCHLAHLSARSFSLLSVVTTDRNFSPIERTLALLMRRDMKAVRKVVFDFKISGTGDDEQIVAAIQTRLTGGDKEDYALPDVDTVLFDNVVVALTDTFFGGIAQFLHALDRGERELLDQALESLRNSLRVCSELNFVPYWWVHRVSIHLLADLWSSSFHVRLPVVPSGGTAPEWPAMRDMFVSSMLCRPRAEIDLWPSQIEAASRAVDQSDDLVVSLPTGAGKTRIAELCILRCLAAGKRTVFVTPLRALSAQTEAALRRTFGPLAKTVSALYGSIGFSGRDEDAFRNHDIVVATPEKLDFALRSNPALLNDVGLLIFDEGHMIGLSEREVRYEVQIQRLLLRADAHNRRIVCLSAILPSGDQMDDFTAWLRRDIPGESIKNDWRPTRLRIGEVLWKSGAARLNLRVGDQETWIPRFLIESVPPKAVPPKRPRTRPFPSNQRELCLATAWRFVDDGQTVLIYCPLRKSVDRFADDIVDLHERGALRSLLEGDVSVLSRATTLGKEWLAPDSAILRCLTLGIALHHGALPPAYRREVERLLRKGILKVTISSPTLAQGLNLTATALVMHSLHRNGNLIEISEFRNVSGRAGRAYVDTEGIVVHPMFDSHRKRMRNWKTITNNATAWEMESGLVLLVNKLLHQMQEHIGGDSSRLIEYVMNNSSAWTLPDHSAHPPAKRPLALEQWERYIDTLDTAILSLIGGDGTLDGGVEYAIDKVLASSLWQRRLLRKSEQNRRVMRSVIISRSKFICLHSTTAQRRGYFLAGVGLRTGHELDAIATEANRLLVNANSAILSGDSEIAIDAVCSIAEMVFAFHPFTPRSQPENWRTLLRQWLQGKPMSDLSPGHESETLHFIEEGLAYRLSWALEAVRVRAEANDEAVYGLTLDNYNLGLAVAAVETGTVNRSATVLIQAGLNSRQAAIKAIDDTRATFTTARELRSWLKSDASAEWREMPDWPTKDTATMWVELTKTVTFSDDRTWRNQRHSFNVAWSKTPPAPGTPVQIYRSGDQSLVLASDGLRLGTLQASINRDRLGLIRASVSPDAQKVDVVYLGPDELLSRWSPASRSQ